MKLNYFLLSLLLSVTTSAKSNCCIFSVPTSIAERSVPEELDFTLIDETDGNDRDERPRTLHFYPEAFINDNSLYFRNGCTHAQLRILSSDGTTVVLNEIINDGDVVSIQGLPAGIYCVQVIRDSCTFAAIINVH